MAAVLFSAPSDDVREIEREHKNLLSTGNFDTERADKTLEILRRGLQSFVRVRTLRSNSAPGRRTHIAGRVVSGTPVEARCQMGGLRVFYSMAFVLKIYRRRTQFGDRFTSPVMQGLPDGIWVFATAAGRDVEDWEDQEILVPDVTAVDLDGHQ